ncbi:transposase [Streptomyces bobili]|uniref:transposase n=1 Tax=Streptomyces bobili TaxID=67280 RepID=UPI003796CEC3
MSTSCRSKWFLEAGGVIVPDPGPISPRFLTQEDRITIADGLQAKQHVKDIAASIGKSFQTVYREIKRGSEPSGGYQPWRAHNQALLRRQRPKGEKIHGSEPLRTLVREKLAEKWSPPADLTPPRPHPCRRSGDAGLPGDDLPGPVRRSARQPARQTPHGSHPPEEAAARCPDTQQDQKHDADPPETAGGQRPCGSRTLGGDLIIGRGQGSAIGTLVERTTRYVELIHLPNGWKAPQVRNAIVTQTAHIPLQMRKTLTWEDAN